MDVNFAARFSCLAAAVLATGVRPLGAAEAAFAAETPSVVVVTATDDGDELQQPHAIAGTQRAGQPSKPELRMPNGVSGARRAPAAQGDLSVVANPTRKGLLSKFLNRKADEAPASHIRMARSQPVDEADDQDNSTVMVDDAEGSYAEASESDVPSEPIQPESVAMAEDGDEQRSYIFVHSDEAPEGAGVQEFAADEQEPSDDSIDEPMAQGHAGVAVTAANRHEPPGRETTTQEGSMWGGLLGGGPRRPAATAGIRTGQRSDRFASPATDQEPQYTYSQLDASDEPQRVATAKPRRPEAPTPKSTDPAGELLVHAYELSLSASSEAEFSQIVRWCAEATRQGVAEDSRQFGCNLSAWALNRRGQLRNEEGQGDLALADFRAALEFDPDNWRALHNRGVINAQAGQFAEAFDDVSRVIQLNPDFAKAYSNRATLYVQAGNFDAAAADYEKALELDDSLVPALVGHGRVCHMAGRRDEAMASFNNALLQKPDDAEIICSRGDLLADMGRYRDALEDYAKAIDLNAHLEHAYRNGAWLLATCPEDAIRDADGALKGAKAALDCGYGERHAALDTLAAALANAGRYEEAVGTIQQAIEIAPSEAKLAYAARQQLYEARQPFRTRPVGGVEAAGFEGESVEMISDN